LRLLCGDTEGYKNSKQSSLLSHLPKERWWTVVMAKSKIPYGTPSSRQRESGAKTTTTITATQETTTT